VSAGPFRATYASALGDYLRDPSRRWTGFVQWLDLFAIYRLVRQSGGSVRIAGEQHARLPAFRTAASDRPPRGWLAQMASAAVERARLYQKRGQSPERG